MKLLQINKYFDPDKGGIESVSNMIDSHLDNDNLEIVNLCFGKENQKYDKSFSTKRYPSKKIFSQPLSLGYFFYIIANSARYDYIIVHFPNVLAMLALLFTKSKFAIFWHSDIVQQNFLLRKFFFPIEKLVISKADKILFATEAHMKGSAHSFETSNIKYVPYTIENEKIASQTYINREQKNNNFIHAIFVGRLVGYKGIEHLIESFPKSDEFKLSIIGSGELENKIKNMLITSSNIKLHLNVDNQMLEDFFSQADILILPSINKSEMFGIVQIEAFARGVPVISTNIADSGVPIVNSSKDTGYLVEPRSSKDIKNKLLDFKKNRSFFRKEKIRAIYDKNYSNISFKKNISKIINV